MDFNNNGMIGNLTKNITSVVKHLGEIVGYELSN